MENFVYNSISNYFNTLSKIGYVKDKTVDSILVLIFYYHLLHDDYRGYINSADYKSIEKALNCLFGSSCLIPYIDYFKMGKLYIGEMTELAQRVKNIEDTDVVKLMDTDGTSDSDIVILEEEEIQE